MKKIILLLLITNTIINANLGDGLSKLFQVMTACLHTQEQVAYTYQPISNDSNSIHQSAEQENSLKKRFFRLLLCQMFLK